MLDSNNSLVNTNSTNSTPYITSDRTELAPLCSNHQDTKGLRIVAICFTVFTVLVSIALMTQLHHGDYQVVPHGTVVSDNRECSLAGIDIMKKGGNAVDAVITTLFCLAVVLPHLVGIGGGGSLLVYSQRQRKVIGCLDFQAAVGSNHSLIGIPGFVAGLYKAHESYGTLPWPVILDPAIQMAKSGFTPSPSLLSAVPLAAGRKELINFLISGKNPQLVTTLESIADKGPNELYNGSLSEQITKYNITGEDLAHYEVVSDGCVEEAVGQYNVAVAGPNSGGPLLVQLLRKININVTLEHPILTIVSNLKETMVVSRPYSSGVNVVASNHNDIYVTAVSGLGSVLGSQELTSGGYLMNNIFTTPHMREESRPPSLSSPIVVTQSNSACGDRFITGTSDVRDAAQVLVELLQSIDITSSNNSPRVRILTDKVLLEKNHEPQLDPYQLAYLQSWNFTIEDSPVPYPSINVIHKIGDTLTAVADSRGGGSPSSF